MAKAQKSSVWGELGAATLGVAVGSVLGMLFAPKSGKETRKVLATKGRKTVASAKRTLKTVEKKGTAALRKVAKKK